MNDVPRPKGTLKATLRTVMFGAREPSPRPTAQDRHPMMVASRHPKRFTKTPITGPTNSNVAMVMELTQATRIIRKISLRSWRSAKTRITRAGESRHARAMELSPLFPRVTDFARARWSDFQPFWESGLY